MLRRSRDGDEYGDGEGAAELMPVVDDTGPAAASYTDTSVTAHTRYVYRVKAINSAGRSPQSSYLNVETPEPTQNVPAKPTGLKAANVTQDSVRITRGDPDDDSITGYQIFRRDAKRGSFTSIEDNTGSANTAYTDNAVEANTTCEYRVAAVNASGTSAKSRRVETKTKTNEGQDRLAVDVQRGLRDEGDPLVILDDDDVTVTIPDANLRRALEGTLAKKFPDRSGAITVAEMEALTGIRARNKGISNLTGLDRAVNITVLDLTGNNLSGSIDLNDWPKLRTIVLTRNSLTDIGDLRGHKKLKYLWVAENNLTGLRLPRQLDLLFAGRNRITKEGIGIDFSGVPNNIPRGIRSIVLEHNRLSDSVAVTSHGNLQYLSVGYNQLVSLKIT